MIAARPSAASRLAGRLAFCAGLAVWVALSWRLLPYDFQDVCYLFSLEGGTVLAQEWVHPLFVPMLAVWRELLAAFGLGARMLIPVEALNLCLGCSTLALLFVAVEKLCRDSLAAAAGALLLGFSCGFWDGSLRVTPYAPAAACAVLSAVLMLGLGPASASRRYAFAGAAAGLAAGFHLSALALLLPGFFAIHREDRETSRLRLTGFFVGGFLAALLAAYAAFLLRSGLAMTWFNLRHSRFSAVFREIEQIPESSLYTSRSLLRQVREFAETLHIQGRPLLQAVLAGGVLAILLGRGRAWLQEPARRASALAGVCAAAFCLFFVLNNSHNGFIFSALLLLPVPLAFALAELGALRWPFLMGCLLAISFSALQGLEHGQDQDPILGEARFLSRLMRPGDVLVVPGSPFPELTYLRHLDILRVGTDGAKDTDVPTVEAGLLAPRLAGTLEQGRRVFFAPGDQEASFTGDVGTQKRRQVFETAGDAQSRRASALALRRRLEGRLRLRCGLASPAGEGYCEVLLKSRVVRRQKAARSEWAPQPCPALAQKGDDPWAALWLAKKVNYLDRWLADSPDDGFARDERERLCRSMGATGTP